MGLRTGHATAAHTTDTASGRERMPRVVAVSVDPAATLTWIGPTRQACRLKTVVRPWGDQLAYEYLRHTRGVLALLDATGREPVSELAQRVRSLSLLAPVTVTVAPDSSVDPSALLSVGAVNVLRRGGSAAAQAARITADVRWLCRGLVTGGPAPGTETARE
ncbi:hypothetical protein ACFVIM_27520, partial [Streptomyces sp. NPDC057638]|uniref:hypothetical protein n=1 Tax=Streptomyces sp. NPDC057638 TaxID=3346190 RepID=UPI00369AEA2D